MDYKMTIAQLNKFSFNNFYYLFFKLTPFSNKCVYTPKIIFFLKLSLLLIELKKNSFVE